MNCITQGCRCVNMVPLSSVKTTPAVILQQMLTLTFPNAAIWAQGGREREKKLYLSALGSFQKVIQGIIRREIQAKSSYSLRFE